MNEDHLRKALAVFNELNGVSLLKPPTDKNGIEQIWWHEWDYFIKGFMAGSQFEKERVSKMLLSTGKP